MILADAQNLALDLMSQHGLALWSFDFDRAKRRCGCCHHDKSKITLSRYFVEANDEHHVRSTMLHEIAHALAVIRYGRRGHGHGPIFRRIAIEIGGNPDRCLEPTAVRHNVPGVLTATCSKCGKSIQVYRRVDTSKSYKHNVSACQGEIIWKENR